MAEDHVTACWLGLGARAKIIIISHDPQRARAAPPMITSAPPRRAADRAVTGDARPSPRAPPQPAATAPVGPGACLLRGVAPGSGACVSTSYY